MEHRTIYESKRRRIQIQHNGNYSKNNSLLVNAQNKNKQKDLKSSKIIPNRVIAPSRNSKTFGISIRNNSHIFISRDENRNYFKEMQNKSSRCLRRYNTSKNINNNYNTQPKALNIDTKPYKNMNNANNQSQKIIFRNEIKKTQTPQCHTNEIKVGNLIYYEKCPYCHHTLNNIPKNEFTNRRISYQKKENDLENRNPKIKNKIGIIYDSYKGEKKIIKNNKLNKVLNNSFGRRSFYVNEKGVIVFKPHKTSSIIIEKTYKPNYERYHNYSITYGKGNNISYYEPPAPEKTVIIRPIFNSE